jgi:hypothetical protein
VRNMSHGQSQEGKQVYVIRQVVHRGDVITKEKTVPMVVRVISVVK